MKPQLGIIPHFYHTYIKKAPENMALSELLKTGQQKMLDYYSKQTDEASNSAYGPDKWSKKEVLVHLTDSERIFANRALRIGRGDKTPLPGFDQNDFMANVKGTDLSLENVIAEYQATRVSTICLLNNLNETALACKGIASDSPINAESIFWIIVGHELHHLGILEERY